MPVHSRPAGNLAVARMLAGLALGPALLLSGCASAATVRPTDAELARPVRTSVEVPLPVRDAEQAIDRVRAAFRAEGLAIASVSEGVVVSEPARVRSRLSVDVDKRYIATVIPEERGVRVVLTGESRLSDRGGAWSVIGSHDPSWPAAAGYHGFLKVRRIAARLAGEQPPDSE